MSEHDPTVSYLVTGVAGVHSTSLVFQEHDAAMALYSTMVAGKHQYASVMELDSSAGNHMGANMLAQHIKAHDFTDVKREWEKF